MLSALRTLHGYNIIHRDLKSANIFLCKDRQQVKLGDMNVSKILKKDFARTQTGTPYYASPEVWRDEEYNSKADIWSLGCVIFELCNLKQPFQASGLDRLYRKVQGKQIERFDNFYSQQLQEVVHKCLTLDYKRRPSARELMQENMFGKFRSPKHSRKEEKEEGHMQTKVKYNGKGGRIDEKETLGGGDRRTEDKLLVMGRKRVKRWGRLISEQDSSSDPDEVILGTIPVDLDFKSLAKKLPKPRYSFSREKKPISELFEAHRRSKSGVRLSENDNKEKLKRLRERRLKLMGEAKVKAKLKAKREKGSIPKEKSPKLKKKETQGTTSNKTKKSRESNSTKSGISRKKKGEKRKMEVIGKKRPKRKLEKVEEPIEKSLLREKEKQEKILSKIEMCHSQLVKQTTQSKSESKASGQQKGKEQVRSQVEGRVARELFEKKGEERRKCSKGNQKKGRQGPVVSQFELNNSYNLLRPIERKFEGKAGRTPKEEYSGEPQVKKERRREREGEGEKRVKTSMDRVPRKIIVDKITYTFSKKDNQLGQKTKREVGEPNVMQVSSRMSKQRESMNYNDLKYQNKLNTVELGSPFQGLPQVKGMGSVPEISLDKGKVVVRQGKETGSNVDKFLQLMQENAGSGRLNQKEKISHFRRKSDDPMRLMTLKGVYRTQNSSEYLGYKKVDFNVE